MKFTLSCLLILMSFWMLSQEKSKTPASATSFTLTKTDLSKVKLLSDLIPNLRENYSYVGYEITAKVAGNIKVWTDSGNELKQTFLSILSKTDINAKMFVDVTTHVNKIPYKDAYSIYVIE